MSITHPMILANIIAAHCQQHPNLDALTFVNINAVGDLEEEVRTYQQLWEKGQFIAAHLDAVGMQAGDSFGLLMQNHPEFVDAMVGASISDTVFVPVDPRTKGHKLAYMLSFAECRGVIVADYALENLSQVINQLPNLEWVWLLKSDSQTLHSETADASLNELPGLQFLENIYKGEVPCLPVRIKNPDGPMQMLFTSGTTGDPKAIVASHRRYGTTSTLGPVFGFKAGDRPYTGLSLTHANAQLITLAMGLLMGLRTVISRKFTKSRLWEITRRYGCTSFNLLGGMTTAIYSQAAQADDGDNPVRFVLSAGMPANVWEHFQRRFKVEIFEFYAAAEGGITLNPPGEGPVGSIGKPPPSLEARVIDEQGLFCAPGEPGEIVFRAAEGDPLKVHYFKNPEASAKKVINGWLRMGDIVYCDAQGWFYFLYRKGGGIRHNGDFINPALVEKTLAEHPLVEDVFVYGVQASSGAPGEKDVVAAIVLSTDKTEAISDLFNHCRQHLESGFVPSYLQIVDEIPKTASEKPQERFLLDQFAHNKNAIFTQDHVSEVSTL